MSILSIQNYYYYYVNQYPTKLQEVYILEKERGHSFTGICHSITHNEREAGDVYLITLRFACLFWNV